MTAAHFSTAETPDIAGTLHGLRAFKVDHTGHLQGIYYSQVWLAGVNQARCMRRPLVFYGPSLESADSPHDDWIDCRCGLYAFTDGSNDFQEKCTNTEDCLDSAHRRVSGIVEGFGRVIYGPRGFRAEKARILALVLPARFASVAKHYPASAVFESVADALSEFPLRTVTL